MRSLDCVALLFLVKILVHTSQAKPTTRESNQPRLLVTSKLVSWLEGLDLVGSATSSILPIDEVLLAFPSKDFGYYYNESSSYQPFQTIGNMLAFTGLAYALSTINLDFFSSQSESSYDRDGYSYHPQPDGYQPDSADFRADITNYGGESTDFGETSGQDDISWETSDDANVVDNGESFVWGERDSSGDSGNRREGDEAPSYHPLEGLGNPTGYEYTPEPGTRVRVTGIQKRNGRNMRRGRQMKRGEQLKRQQRRRGKKQGWLTGILGLVGGAARRMAGLLNNNKVSHYANTVRRLRR